MVEVKLFIEGTNDNKNGDLRKGFGSLLEKILKGRMPRIIMGDDRKQTIKKFLNETDAERKLLLIDLDAPKEKRESVLTELNIQSEQESVFFMVQETEAWFCSQPEILDEVFGEEISKKVPKRDPQDIPNPDEKLQEWTRQSPKGKYHKVKHAVELLQKLNAQKLQDSFPDVKNLFSTLQSTYADL
ncbi:MAG: DUF4276 family protein [Chloroherpetonaceae bacterium]